MNKQQPKLKWEFSCIPHALTFRLGDEPEIVHFIRTGFTGEYSYHVIQEDGYQIKPDGKDFLMSDEEILKRFGIDIKSEFDKKFETSIPIALNKYHKEDAIEKVKDMTDDEITKLISESLTEVNGMYHIDYYNVVHIMSYVDASRFNGLLLEYAKSKNIHIITAIQNGKKTNK